MAEARLYCHPARCRSAVRPATFAFPGNVGVTAPCGVNELSLWMPLSMTKPSPMFVRSLKQNGGISKGAFDMIGWIDLQKAQDKEKTDERKQPEIKLTENLARVHARVRSLLDV